MPAPKAIATANDGGTATLAVTVPAATAAGDLILIRFSTNTGSPTTITISGSGWSVAQDNTQTGSTASMMWWKVATASDAGSVVTATYAASSRVAAICAVFAAGSFDPSSPINVTSSVDTPGPAITQPAVTTTKANCTILLWDVQQATGSTFSFTPPSGFTLSTLVNSTKASGKNNAQALAWSDVGSAGTYGTWSVTFNPGGSAGGANTIAIAPAQATGQSYQRSASDTAAIADSIAVKRQLKRSSADAASKLDSVAIKRQLLRAGSDVSAPSDAVAAAKALLRAASDMIIGQSDITAITRGTTRFASDVLAALDAVSRKANLVRKLSDASAKADSAVAQKAFGRIVADALSPSDAVVWFGGVARKAIDVMSPVDVAARGALSFLRSVDELLAPDEVVTWTGSHEIPPPIFVGPVKVLLTGNLSSGTITRYDTKLVLTRVATKVALTVRDADAAITAFNSKLVLTKNKSSASVKLITTKAEWRYDDMSQWKTGDTYPPAEVKLLNTDGTPVNLTGATAVKFHSKPQQGTGKTINAAMQQKDAANGVVTYAWQAGDLDTVGDFNAEVEVTWSDGTIQTFPAAGYVTYHVSAQLDQ